MRRYSASIQTLGWLFRDQTFVSPDYQREFCWEKEKIDELIDSLSKEFFRQFSPGHSNAIIAGYDEYFLGRIVVVPQGKFKFVLDGWQRIVGLTLLLIYFDRQLASTGCFGASPASLISHQRSGKRSIHLECKRIGAAVQSILDGTHHDFVDDDIAVANIKECYKHFENSGLFQALGKSVAEFLFFLKTKVVFEEFVADGENAFLYVFSLLNSEGRTLSPKEVAIAAQMAASSVPIDTALSQE